MQICQPAASAAKPSARGDWTTRVFAAFISVAAAIIIGGAAQAQQSAKSGKYTGKAAANPAEGVEQIYELEKATYSSWGCSKGYSSMTLPMVSLTKPRWDLRIG